MQSFKGQAAASVGWIISEEFLILSSFVNLKPIWTNVTRLIWLQMTWLWMHCWSQWPSILMWLNSQNYCWLSFSCFDDVIGEAREIMTVNPKTSQWRMLRNVLSRKSELEYSRSKGKYSKLFGGTLKKFQSYSCSWGWRVRRHCSRCKTSSG